MLQLQLFSLSNKLIALSIIFSVQYNFGSSILVSLTNSHRSPPGVFGVNKIDDSSLPSTGLMMLIVVFKFSLLIPIITFSSCIDNNFLSSGENSIFILAL